MSEYVIVRINEELIPDYQLSYNKHNNHVQKRAVSSWTQITNNKEVILILAGSLVLHAKVKIPSKSEEVIRQSLPYAMEEQLGNDIEQNHYAYRTDNEELMVCVVKKDIVEEIKQQLKTHKIPCKRLYSEIYTVPTLENAITLCEFEDYYIVNKQNLGSTIQKNMLPVYLQLQTKQQKVIFSQKDYPAMKQSDYVFKKHDTALLQSSNLIAALTHKLAINIFQGQYSQIKPHKKASNKSTTTLMALLALIGSWLLINGYQLWHSGNEIEQLKEQQKSLLQKLIPNASTTEKNDPYAALQSRLKQSQSSQNSKKSTGFLQGLYYLGMTLGKHSTIQIQSFRHRDSKLEVKLIAQDVTELNRFQADLAKNSLNMRIKTGTRESNKEGILSVITMEKL